jgi:hypothetical protein
VENNVVAAKMKAALAIKDFFIAMLLSGKCAQ